MACPPTVYNELPHHKLRLRGNLVTSTATRIFIFHGTALGNGKVLLGSLYQALCRHQIVGQLNGRSLVLVMLAGTQGYSIKCSWFMPYDHQSE